MPFYPVDVPGVQHIIEKEVHQLSSHVVHNIRANNECSVDDWHERPLNDRMCEDITEVTFNIVKRAKNHASTIRTSCTHGVYGIGLGLHGFAFFSFNNICFRAKQEAKWHCKFILICSHLCSILSEEVPMVNHSIWMYLCCTLLHIIAQFECCTLQKQVTFFFHTS